MSRRFMKKQSDPATTMTDQECLCIVVNVPLKMQDAMDFFGRGKSKGWSHVCQSKKLD